jgi:hypothetical protein
MPATIQAPPIKDPVDKCSPRKSTEAKAAKIGSLLIRIATLEGEVLCIMVNCTKKANMVANTASYPVISQNERDK